MMSEAQCEHEWEESRVVWGRWRVCSECGLRQYTRGEDGSWEDGPHGTFIGRSAWSPDDAELPWSKTIGGNPNVAIGYQHGQSDPPERG